VRRDAEHPRDLLGSEAALLGELGVVELVADRDVVGVAANDEDAVRLRLVLQSLDMTAALVLRRLRIKSENTRRPRGGRLEVRQRVLDQLVGESEHPGGLTDRREAHQSVDREPLDVHHVGFAEELMGASRRGVAEAQPPALELGSDSLRVKQRPSWMISPAWRYLAR
jgi:hypothetical protein